MIVTSGRGWWPIRGRWLARLQGVDNIIKTLLKDGAHDKHSNDDDEDDDDHDDLKDGDDEDVDDLEDGDDDDISHTICWQFSIIS